MSAIASEAGVSVQTLYLAFGSKAGILSATLDVAIAGDDEPVPLIDRPWVQALRVEEDGRRAVALMCREVAQLFRRVAPLHVAIRAATGDAEVADLLARDQQSRYATQLEFVAILAAKPEFNADLGEDRGADLVYCLLSEAVYLLFCGDRNWSVEEWTDWVAVTLSNELFPVSSQTR
jgi:AcrR family transcriptional regulator